MDRPALERRLLGHRLVGRGNGQAARRRAGGGAAARPWAQRRLPRGACQGLGASGGGAQQHGEANGRLVVRPAGFGASGLRMTLTACIYSFIPGSLPDAPAAVACCCCINRHLGTGASSWNRLGCVCEQLNGLPFLPQLPALTRPSLAGRSLCASCGARGYLQGAAHTGENVQGRAF